MFVIIRFFILESGIFMVWSSMFDIVCGISSVYGMLDFIYVMRPPSLVLLLGMGVMFQSFLAKE